MPTKSEIQIMWFNMVYPATVTSVIGVDSENYLRVVSNGKTLRLVQPSIQYPKKLHKIVAENVAPPQNNTVINNNLPLNSKMLSGNVSYTDIDNVKISCIISYKQVDKYRQHNLDNVIRHISNFKLDNLEIIVVEQDAYEKFDSTPYKNTKKIFIYNDGEFNKGWGYNVGAKESSGDVLFFCDCDIILPEEFFINSIKKLNTHDVVDTHSIIASYDEENTVNLINSNFKSYQDLHKNVVDTVLISGGAFLIKKQIYLDIHGFDERFIGWGYEDCAFDLKLKKLNINVCRLQGQFCFHLYHHRCAMNNVNNNISIFKEFESMSTDMFKSYLLSHTNIGDKNKFINTMSLDTNNGFDFFDEIRCINLDKRVDRWNAIQLEFNKCNIGDRVDRFSAIMHSDGRLGCIKSHLEIIKQAKANNLDNVLIFEDDAIFINNNINNIIRECTSQLPADWELFYLGANLHIPIPSYSKNLAILNYAYATHAIAYSKNVYDKFIDKFENLLAVTKQDDILDVWLANHIQPSGKSYIAKPILATQKNDFSDINNSQVNYSFIVDRYNKFIN